LLAFNKFSRFLIGGFINFAIKLSLTIFLTEIIRLWYFLSYVITLVIIVLFSFFYNAYVTYKVSSNKRNNFIRYCIVLALISAIDAIAVRAATEMLELHYAVSIFIITVVLFIVKYVVYGALVFKCNMGSDGKMHSRDETGKNIKAKNSTNQNIAGNYYNKYESKNPLVRMLMANFHKILFSLIAQINPREILELGCGEGYLAVLLKKNFKKIDIEASDVEKEVIDLARSESKKRGYQIRYSVESVYSLKRKDNSYDVVLASEVLEHLETPDKAIKEIKRVSRRYCFFSVPYEPFWRIANMARFAYLSDLGNTPGHIQHWSKSGFKRLLKKHFKNVKIKNALLWNFAVCYD